MNKENVLKAVLMLGGGLLLFMLVKPKAMKSKDEASEKKSFDSKENYPTPDPANANIVAEAYSAALKAGESSQKLNELNKECMKDYGMRCYVNKEGSLVVCDVSGKIIQTK